MEIEIGRYRPERRRLKDWAIAAEALTALAASSLAIRLLSFRTVVAAASRGKAATSGEAALAEARRVRWAIEAVARRVPWRTVCFQKGLALHWMLRRRGIETKLHYGVGNGEERGLSAHVWVTLADKAVIGGEEAGDYACLATYPADAAEQGRN